MATLSNCTVPDPREHLLDGVERAHAHPAGGDDDVGPHQLALEGLHELPRVVGHSADPERRGAHGPHRGGEHDGVGVDDLAEARLAAGLDELVAGGQHHDPGPGHDPDPGDAGRGEQGDLAGAEQGARPQDDLARVDVLARMAHVLARCRGTAQGDVDHAAVGLLDGHDGVGAARHRRAGHDPHGLAGGQGQRVGVAGRDVVDDGEHHGASRDWRPRGPPRARHTRPSPSW